MISTPAIPYWMATRLALRSPNIKLAPASQPAYTKRGGHRETIYTAGSGAATGATSATRPLLQHLGLVDIHVQRPPRRKRGRVLLGSAGMVFGSQHAAHAHEARELDAGQLIRFATVVGG